MNLILHKAKCDLIIYVIETCHAFFPSDFSVVILNIVNKTFIYLSVHHPVMNHAGRLESSEEAVRDQSLVQTSQVCHNSKMLNQLF